MIKTKETKKAKYILEEDDSFVIENYNQSQSFSNFFPGIAGVWGTPMWVFYVNRGQAIASCGIESKDKAIMEFHPANKSYRFTPLQGFRTFIKIKSGNKKSYYEPFQNNLLGTNFKKKQTMSVTAHDLTIEEINYDLGLVVKVNYFTIPDEPFAALARRVSVENISNKQCELEIIDGAPMIVPYGLTDWVIKNMSRTVEAWIKVRNTDKKAPYYQLNVEVSDKPQVKHIKEGNFYFSFDSSSKKSKNELLDMIVETAVIFDDAKDFAAPVNFLEDGFKIPKAQQTDNRTPSAMSHGKFNLKPKDSKEITSLMGYADTIEQLNKIVSSATKKGFIDNKADRNKNIINKIRSFSLTRSSSKEFDLYSSHTFMDNVLRGGMPVSLKTKDGSIAFNVFSRKHGDLERDYNYFTVSPTFFSQGNGNYRDVNQNRRNDTWFNKDVGDNHLVSFLNLIQADGYNPLVVRGTAFLLEGNKKVNEILKLCKAKESENRLREFLSQEFQPGELLKFIVKNNIKFKVSLKDFLSKILEISKAHESADHGEGFWIDHWTYNMDMIESYLALYPENLKDLLLKKKIFSFYPYENYMLERDSRFISTDNGVRQYSSVAKGNNELKAKKNGNKLRKRNGEGAVYNTILICKLLCLIANKIATLDPSGVGVEMEADKPNWYDALNGLPGLMGSSLSETLEIRRLAEFLLTSMKELCLEDNYKILIFGELFDFLSGLTNVLVVGGASCSYWDKSNSLKERFRKLTRDGIKGEEKEITVANVNKFLKAIVKKTVKSQKLAEDSDGNLRTYFYHEIKNYRTLNRENAEGISFVKPIKFKIHALPSFLEGNVHAFRVAENKLQAQQLYKKVRKSDLFDKKLKMYKVNTSLSKETEEIGRARIFPSGWLENESIWLHMEYKFILELLKSELYDEFYDNLENVLVPFLDPYVYGRSILENSSFIVSSSHNDSDLHGRGFVARLSGSTAEFVHIWLLMNVGKNPFSLDQNKKLKLSLNPALKGKLFTKKE
ncbi:MAG: hypothetical protein P9X22_08200, partial [Candidatus Zapsychrus exili]|nr:hypothetical protein [Candidatus Zapsychrus exili]